MNKRISKNRRVLAIAPSTRGFGFALLEGRNTLVDWGVKSVKRDKNSQSLAKVKDLIRDYQPDVIILEDTSAKDSRRGPRIRTLTKEIIALGSNMKFTIRLYSQAQIRKALFPDGKGTKHAIAEMVAKAFPDELAHRLPPKRRPWNSEDSRMGIFDAVALALINSDRA